MVRLSKIVTKNGDLGSTRLASGEEVSKSTHRIRANGAVDELNAVIGLVILAIKTEVPENENGDLIELMQDLTLLQNELFDLGADISTPDSESPLEWTPIRVQAKSLDRLDKCCEDYNARLEPLTSFILPGGSAVSTWLHLARTICRRAETEIVALNDNECNKVSKTALAYINRLSDYFFILARFFNNQGKGDILWVPNLSRPD